MINIYQPDVGSEELEAVGHVFESRWLGRGERTRRFTTEFAQRIGVSARNCITVNSCTEALFQIIELLFLQGKVKVGDEVVLPSIHYVGAAHAAAYRGLSPVFCDVRPDTMNTTLPLLRESIGPRTRAVILLHYGGFPCDDIEAIVEYCGENNIVLIEDSAAALGGTLNGRPLGTFGDYGVWSFDPMKIITTGDGGMIYAKDATGISVLESLLYTGHRIEDFGFAGRDASDTWWELDVNFPSRRSIMNDIAAAMGLEQLKKLDAFLKRRREIFRTYETGFHRGSGIEPCRSLFAEKSRASHQFYWIRLESSELRDALAVYLKGKGIYTNVKYYPLHKLRIYGGETCPLDRFPGAEEAFARTLCLPNHPSLTDEEVDYIIQSVLEFPKDASQRVAI